MHGLPRTHRELVRQILLDGDRPPQPHVLRQITWTPKTTHPEDPAPGDSPVVSYPAGSACFMLAVAHRQSRMQVSSNDLLFPGEHRSSNGVAGCEPANPKHYTPLRTTECSRIEAKGHNRSEPERPRKSRETLLPRSPRRAGRRRRLDSADINRLLLQRTTISARSTTSPTPIRLRLKSRITVSGTFERSSSRPSIDDRIGMACR